MNQPTKYGFAPPPPLHGPGSSMMPKQWAGCRCHVWGKFVRPAAPREAFGRRWQERGMLEEKAPMGRWSWFAQMRNGGPQRRRHDGSLTPSFADVVNVHVLEHGYPSLAKLFHPILAKCSLPPSLCQISGFTQHGGKRDSNSPKKRHSVYSAFLLKHSPCQNCMLITLLCFVEGWWEVPKA